MEMQGSNVNPTGPMSPPGPGDITNPVGGEPIFYDPNNGLVDASAADDEGAGCACDSQNDSPTAPLALVLGLWAIGRFRRLV